MKSTYIYIYEVSKNLYEVYMEEFLNRLKTQADFSKCHHVLCWNEAQHLQAKKNMVFLQGDLHFTYPSVCTRVFSVNQRL